MKHLIMFGVLIVGGQTYWTPCERGAIFCPHFNSWGTSDVDGYVKVNVNADGEVDDEDGDINLVYVDHSEAPSMVIVGVDE